MQCGSFTGEVPSGACLAEPDEPWVPFLCGGLAMTRPLAPHGCLPYQAVYSRPLHIESIDKDGAVGSETAFDDLPSEEERVRSA